MHNFKINPDLYENLQKETDKDLFYYFKTDGLIGFEKKLLAGKILHSRRFDSNLLRFEKAKIIDKVKTRIDYYSCDSEHKHASKLRKRIIMSAAFTPLLIIIQGIPHFTSDKPLEINIFTVIAVSAIVFDVVIRILLYRRNLEKKLKEDARTVYINKMRLDVIEKEWNF